LLELQREHSQLAARFAEAQDNYEEALEVRAGGAHVFRGQASHNFLSSAQVKDRTIEQLANALRARDEALEKQVAGLKAAQVSAL
jgi:uncharacterized protein YukE